jgi:hypothetical protein
VFRNSFFAARGRCQWTAFTPQKKNEFLNTRPLSRAAQKRDKRGSAIAFDFAQPTAAISWAEVVLGSAITVGACLLLCIGTATLVMAGPGPALKSLGTPPSGESLGYYRASRRDGNRARPAVASPRQGMAQRFIAGNARSAMRRP